jgi:putative transposase
MIDPGHPRLSIVRQCELVSIGRSSFYREATPESAENLVLMRLIDEQFLETPWYGSRQMARHLRRDGWCVGRHRVRRLMTRMGLAPIYQHPKTSEPHPRHKICPYLLRHLAIDRPNQVWCADITYIQMRRGFLYLVAIMDWASRKVLAWRLSNTMDTEFCVAALEEAIARHGRPDIFNTDQGSQFTSFAFTATLKDAGIRISMDGRGRWMDNVFIGRLWRSLKYECLRDRQRGTVQDCSLDRILQRRAPALGARRQDARRGLCYAGKGREIGGVIEPRTTFAKPPFCPGNRDHLNTSGARYVFTSRSYLEAILQAS